MLLPVPAPDLTGVDPSVREQLEEARRLVAESPDPASAAERGRRFGSAGRIYLLYELLASAEASFRNAAALDPAEARWPYYLGVILQQDGRLEEAIEAFERVLEIDPGNVPALVRAGQAELELARIEGAEGRFREALERRPALDVARYGLARIAMERERYEEAATLLREVVRSQPEAGAARHQLGLALRALGDTEGARALLSLPGERSSWVQFEDPWLQVLGGLVRGIGLLVDRAVRARAAGDRPAAIGAYREVLRLDPERLDVRLVLGNLLAESGDPAAAVAELRELLRRDPDHVGGHMALGSTLAARGEAEEAIEHLRRAVELAPTLAEARVRLATLLAEGGRYGEAEAILADAAELLPDVPRVRLERARLLGALGRYPEAAGEFARYLEHHPEDREARFGHALALLLTGHYAATRRVLESGLTALPEDLPLRHLLARLLATCPDPALRDGERALALARQVAQVRLVPEHAETLAMALAESGRFAEAADLQRQIVERLEGTGQPRPLAAARRRLAGYEVGRPVRSPWLDDTP